MLPVTKPPFVSDLGPVDITVVRELVRRLSERVWHLENERKENNFPVFHHTRHIIFRFIEGMRDHRCYYSCPIWNVWQNHLFPLLDQVVLGVAPGVHHDDAALLEHPGDGARLAEAPPCLSNAWRMSALVRFRLSVSASTRIATPPAP